MVGVLGQYVEYSSIFLSSFPLVGAIHFTPRPSLRSPPQSPAALLLLNCQRDAHALTPLYCTTYTTTVDRNNSQCSQYSQSEADTMGDHRAASSSLWPARDDPTAAAAAAASSSGNNNNPTRDVASMKAEIAQVQSETTTSLDRAIAAAQAASTVGNHVSEGLQEQREKMGQIDADAREIDSDLKRTGYNLKHGFTWRGALTSPFRRASKTPQGAGIGGGASRNISPVFKDDYNGNASSSKKAGKGAPAHGGSVGAAAPPHRSSKNKGGKGTAAAGRGGGAGNPANNNNARLLVSEHVPEGFDKQLDDLDGLLDGLNFQAKAIGAELRQQNDAVEALGANVDPLRVEAASQAKQIKSRFRVKG